MKEGRHGGSVAHGLPILIGLVVMLIVDQVLLLGQGKSPPP